MPTVIKKLDAGAYQLKDQVVAINRVTKVVKGGKNLSFAALVVVGDPSAAVVGYGSGNGARRRRPAALAARAYRHVGGNDRIDGRDSGNSATHVGRRLRRGDAGD